MRPALALLLGAAFTTSVVGCTLLVSFDDAPASGAADDDDDTVDSGRKPGSSTSSSSSGETSSSSSGETSSSSSSSSSSGGAFPPACDTMVVLDQINCNGNTQPVCAKELPATPAGIQVDDLIECNAGGTATCVRRCTMGCAGNGGNTSQCVNCVDKASPEIWYCGKDMGWATDVRDFAIKCSNGKLAATSGCGTNLCHSKCTRTSPPPLNGACCQANPE